MDDQQPITISWGELLWDLFPDGPRLGGAAANVSYHAALLGDRALLVSRVGDDELGSRAIAELRAAGVETSYIQLDTSAPTGTVNVEVVAGEPRYKIATQVAWDRIEWQPALASVFRTATAFCFGTLAQRSPLGFAIIEQALSHSSEGCIRLCDLNIRKPFATKNIVDRALGLANVVKLNEAELAALAELFNAADPLDWLTRKRGVSLVAVTLGSNGCILATRDKRITSPAVPLSARTGDAVGAGDAFAAVLAHELPRAQDLEAIAERANRYASHVASNPGAMPEAPAWLRSGTSTQNPA